jgi:hypothetical protein
MSPASVRKRDGDPSTPGPTGVAGPRRPTPPGVAWHASCRRSRASTACVGVLEGRNRATSPPRQAKIALVVISGESHGPCGPSAPRRVRAGGRRDPAPRRRAPPGSGPGRRRESKAHAQTGRAGAHPRSGIRLAGLSNSDGPRPPRRAPPAGHWDTDANVALARHCAEVGVHPPVALDPRMAAAEIMAGAGTRSGGRPTSLQVPNPCALARSASGAPRRRQPGRDRDDPPIPER